ncbi:cell division protein SepF [Candidatus Woesearchaeota archaeon]|nr:cell division protein SepF [Candidatus Woesearchaeota archaeon]
MGGFLSKFKKTFGAGDEKERDDDMEMEDEYVELDSLGVTDKKSKVIVRSFVINDFSDIKLVLDSLREGMTIALVNIKPLKSKDLVELKRAINKLKKTCEAIDGDIAGFGDDYLIVVPTFAEIYRSKDTASVGGTTASMDEME